MRDTIIVVLTVPPEKWVEVERLIATSLGERFPPGRAAPWIPGHALEHVTSARVNGHTVFNREES